MGQFFCPKLRKCRDFIVLFDESPPVNREEISEVKPSNSPCYSVNFFSEKRQKCKQFYEVKPFSTERKPDTFCARNFGNVVYFLDKNCMVIKE